MKSDAIKYIPVNLANILISFGMITILTRILTAAEFGRYALVVTTLHFLHMGLFTWLEASMARFHEREALRGRLTNHYKSLYLSAALASALGLSVVLALIYIVPIDARLKTLLTFALFSSAIHLIYNLTQEGHKAAQRISRYSVIHSTQLILSFTIGILLAMFTPLKEGGPFVGMIIGGIIAILVELPTLLTRLRKGVFDGELIKEYFVFGTSICFSLVLAYALENGDLFFIKYFMNDQSVGAYSAGYNLASRSFDFIFVWLAMAAMPVAISNLERKGIDHARRVLREYCNILIIITVPAAVGIALVSKEAVFILGEPVREGALSVMPWIAFAALLNGFINYYAHQAFVLAKKLNILAGLLLIPVLINFGLNIIFIPQYGLHGAVISTLSAYAVATILIVSVARKIFTLPLPVMTLAKCSAGCLIMSFALLNIPFASNWPDLLNLVLKAAIGASIYGVVIYALDTADIRKMIKSNLPFMG